MYKHYAIPKKRVFFVFISAYFCEKENSLIIYQVPINIWFYKEKYCHFKRNEMKQIEINAEIL